MLHITQDKIDFENGTYDLVVCFYHNSDCESYERNYKSVLWFEDGKGNKIKIPDFIFKNSLSVIGFQITINDNLHGCSDYILEIIEADGYNNIKAILYSNDAWYIGFKK